MCHKDEPSPPYPPAALPSISMATAATELDLGSAAPYGLTQGVRGWVWRCVGWFACFGDEKRPHQKIEVNMVYWPWWPPFSGNTQQPTISRRGSGGLEVGDEARGG